MTASGMVTVTWGLPSRVYSAGAYCAVRWERKSGSSMPASEAWFSCLMRSPANGWVNVAKWYEERLKAAPSPPMMRFRSAE